MAEVVKAKDKEELSFYQEKEKQESVTKNCKKTGKGSKKSDSNSTLWDKFMNFCYGVKNEIKKVRWTSKKDMIKYSIATITFILFCSIFFYGSDTIFALVQSLFN